MCGNMRKSLQGHADVITDVFAHNARSAGICPVNTAIPSLTIFGPDLTTDSQ